MSPGFNWVHGLHPVGPFQYEEQEFHVATREGQFDFVPLVDFSGGGADPIESKSNCNVYWVAYESYFPDHSLNTGQDINIRDVSHAIYLNPKFNVSVGDIADTNGSLLVDSYSYISRRSHYIFDKYPPIEGSIKNKFWNLTRQFRSSNDLEITSPDFVDPLGVSLAELGFWKIKFNLPGGGQLITTRSTDNMNLFFHFLIAGHYDPIKQLPFVRVDCFFLAPHLYKRNDHLSSIFSLLSLNSPINQLNHLFADKLISFSAEQTFDYSIFEHLS
jgi:hypothetical protein